MNPWEYKQNDKRDPNSLPTFIIFCEDEVSEPIYFKYFETARIKVNPVKNQKSKIENILKAITHCVGKGLMIYENDLPKLIAKDTHIWCVYDRDLESIDNKKLDENNVSFNAAIETAKSCGINVAWSNDSFELWVLLHFEDVDPSKEENKFRKTYYSKLTNIFKSIQNPNPDLAKALAYVNFNYKESLKSESNFRNIVRVQMINDTKTAIDRAKKLEKHFTSSSPSNEKTPCTMVHYLVEELIRTGGKNIS